MLATDGLKEDCPCLFPRALIRLPASTRRRRTSRPAVFAVMLAQKTAARRGRNAPSPAASPAAPTPRSRKVGPPSLVMSVGKVLLRPSLFDLTEA